MGQVIKWRGLRSRHSSAKLTEDDVVLIKALLIEGLSASEIAQKFEVTRHIIWRIKAGHTWKHVPNPEEINNE